jgi:hypothetical protein
MGGPASPVYAQARETAQKKNAKDMIIPIKELRNLYTVSPDADKLHVCSQIASLIARFFALTLYLNIQSILQIMRAQVENQG